MKESDNKTIRVELEKLNIEELREIEKKVESKRIQLIVHGVLNTKLEKKDLELIFK